MARTGILDDFAPKPTVFTGGMARMIRLWECCRDANAGGYGSGVLQSIRGWGSPSSSRVTSCSPFTATVIGMMFDARGGEDPSVTYEPKYDEGRAVLPSAFYAMHNGFFFAKGAVGDARRQQFHRRGWTLCDDPARSIVFWNLGYEIDPRDMRRGDFVAIDWANGGGRAAFCWDVHLDDAGAADCFLYLSSNGRAQAGGGDAGVGVSVGTTQPRRWVEGSPGSYRKTRTMFADHNDHTEHGSWLCLPGIDRTSVKRDTFKDAPPALENLVDRTAGGHAVASLRVVRFWGVAPPAQPHGRLLGDNAGLAHRLAREPAPASYATGRGAPSEGRIENVCAEAVPRRHPEPFKAVPPARVHQKPAQVVGHQYFVEAALAELHAGGWIDCSPGSAAAVGDGDTRAAIRDSQAKLDVTPIDGIAGRTTRKALERALTDLRAGKRNPTKRRPPPVIDRFYFPRNRVEPGGTSVVTVQGQHLDLVEAYELELTDQSGRAHRLAVALDAAGGRGVQRIAIPAEFGAGSVLTARLSATAGGARLDKTSDVPLYVGKLTPGADDWPWNESAWPVAMQRIVAELRATRRGPGNFHVREITQYGVKQASPGDVAVLDRKGRELGRVDKRSLFLADIEGTMRLAGRMLSMVSSGNDHDQMVTTVISGVVVKRPAPSLDTFEPAFSRWVDVTERAPWGVGARLPLIPFRVLAHNARTETPLYLKTVYIEQLDGVVLPTGEVHNGMCVVGDCGSMAPAGGQLDLFVGRRDHHVALPSAAATHGSAVSRVEILGDCAAAHHPAFAGPGVATRGDKLARGVPRRAPSNSFLERTSHRVPSPDISTGNKLDS